MAQQKKSLKEYQRITELQISANNLLNWLFQGKSEALNKEPTFVLDLFRKNLLDIYSLLLGAQKKKTLYFEKYQAPKDKKHIPVKNISRIFQKNSRYFKDAIMLGSVATGEVIPNWSDLDMLVIVKKSALENSNNFIQLRKSLFLAEKELYKFDPFQHHGIQFIFEDDLGFYPEYFMPLEVLKYGKSLIKKGKTDFYIRNSKDEQKRRFYSLLKLFEESSKTGIFRHHARNGVYLKNNFLNKKDNFYQLKYFISVVLMLPSYFLELLEGSCYKKDSFCKIRKYFKEEDLEIIEKCEGVRNLFRKLKVKGNTIPEEVVKMLGKNYFERAEKLTRKMVKIYEVRKSA